MSDLEKSRIIKRRVKPGQSEESIAKKPRNDPGSSDKYVTTNGSSVRGMWESSAGMIIRVLMKNFMCHGELDYRPTERLNFLHGVNGSGKSAVLSAIVFALGATARMSNRGTSNKSFVRSGQASASVEISLSNEGEDAYRPDIYGNIITIVRSISTSGASTYKIKDHRGRIMCDKKVREELDRITEAFSIQVDNPIAILNQDAAKTFLFKCDPSKLYEFFMRATQLEDCKRDYNVAAEEKNVSEAHIKDKEDSIPDIKREVSVWEKKYQFHQTLENKRETVTKLKTELAWSMAKQAELQFSNASKEMAQQEQKIEKANGYIEKDAITQQNLKKEKLAVEKDIQQLAKESDEFDNVLNGYKENLKLAKEEERKMSKQISLLDRNKKSKIQELNVLTGAITKVRDTDEDEVRQQSEKRMKRISEMIDMQSQYEAKIQSTQAHVNNLNHNISSSATREKELRASMIRINNDIGQKEKQLQAIQKQRDNKLIVFGEGYPKLIQEIQKNRNKFKVLPIGPVGAHLKLAPKTSTADAKLVEFTIRNVLRTFLADNFDDKRMLDQIASRCNLRLTIITSKFRNDVYDTSQGRCQSDSFDTVFDRLEFDNPNVANCLIDQCKAERILLINEDSQAQQVLKKESTTPRNCLHALTGGYNQYYPAPSYRTYALDINPRSRGLLQTSVDDMEQETYQEINTLQESRKVIKSDIDANQLEIKGHEKERNLSEKVCRELRPKISSIAMQIQELKNEAESQKSPDISALEEDKEKLEEDLSDINKSVSKLNSEMDDAKNETKRFNDMLEKKKEEFDEITKPSEPLRQRLDSIENEYNTSVRSQAHYKGKVQEYKAAVEEKKAVMEQKEEKYKKQLEKAESFSKTPIETRKKAEALFRELQVTEESIKRAENSHEPKELVEKKYREIRTFFNNLIQQIGCLKETVKYLDNMLRYRKKGYQELRGSICRIISSQFETRLQTRKYRGCLEFDHSCNQLQIYVDPSGEGNEINRRDMKTLSGGEKSYSTICLVLSLWKEIQPPFRILDEFDVFMDSINRRISLDLIINFAKEERKSQYIFLTPLSLENLKEEKEDVTVVYFSKNEG